MNTDDKVAIAAEAASDRMQEKAWGGDGPEDPPVVYTSEEFARAAGDIMLPEPEDKVTHSELMIALRDALFWHESMLEWHSRDSDYSMERALVMTERLAKLGRLLINDIYRREYRCENFKDER